MKCSLVFIFVVSTFYVWSEASFVFSIKLGMGMMCSSCHTFASIDLTLCTPGIYIQVSGSRRKVHDSSEPTQKGGPTPSFSIQVCAPSIQGSGDRRRGQTPSSLPRPWVEPHLPSSMPVCSTVVVGFLKLTKIQCFHEELLHYAVLVKVVINFKSADILQSYCSGLAFLISGTRFLLTQNKKYRASFPHAKLREKLFVFL